jgi:hypothetical protein
VADKPTPPAEDETDTPPNAEPPPSTEPPAESLLDTVREPERDDPEDIREEGEPGGDNFV